MTDRALDFAAALVILSAVLTAIAFAIGAALLVAVVSFGVLEPYHATAALGLASIASASAALRWYKNPDGLRNRIRRLVLNEGVDS